MTSIKDFLNALQDTYPEDIPIGTIKLKDLDDGSFEKIVNHHNQFIEDACVALPSSCNDLRWRIKGLKIPTRDEFESMLDDSVARKRIPRPLRNGSLSHWRQWVCTQPPMTTLFRWKFKKGYDFSINSEYFARHSVTYGASGSGKSVLLYTMVMSWIQEPSPKTVVCLDPHGDLVSGIAHNALFRLQSEHADRLVLIDPELALSQKATPCMNPLDISEMDWGNEKIEKYAAQLASGFEAMLDEGTSLSLQMRALIYPCLVTLLHREGSTFKDLLRMMDDSRNQDLLKVGLNLPNPEHRDFFRIQFSKSGFKRTKDSIAVKLLSLCNNSLFAKMICQPKSTVHLERLLNEGNKVILISTSKGVLGSDVSSSIGKLICSSLLGISFNRAEQTPENRVPTYFVIDESQNYISEETIATGIAEARKYGLSFNFAQQVVGQGMSLNLKKLILGNTSVKMIGKSGSSSQNAMAREMGLEGQPDFLQGLGTGRFVVQKGSNPPCRIQVRSDYADKKHWMSPTEWAEVEQIQIQCFYHPISSEDEMGSIHTEIQFSPDGDPISAPPAIPSNQDYPEGLI